jgi:type IV pilus assembly protein PilX
MNISQQRNTRKGFIIVITLIILLVMTTMGIGLFYSTKQTAKQVSISGSRTESLYTAESCITEAVHWIEIESAKGTLRKNCTKGSICKRFNSKRMDQWSLSGESTVQRNRMNAHRYRCDISLLGTVSSGSGTGTGFDVSQSGSYGGGTTSTKYLYKIKVRADGSDNVMSEVEVIASTIF